MNVEEGATLHGIDSTQLNWRVFARVAATHFHLTQHPTIYCLANAKTKQNLGANLRLLQSSTTILGVLMYIIFFPIALGLPFLYAHTLMEVPCNEQVFVLNEKEKAGLTTNGTIQVGMHAPESTCGIENFLLSPYSFLLGPGCLLAMGVIIFSAAPLFKTLQYCKPNCLITSFYPGLPSWVLQKLFHMKFRPMFERISYNTLGGAQYDAVNFLGSSFYLFQAPLFWITGYLLLLTEFVVLAFLHGNPGIGIIIGFGVAELFAVVANSTMGQSSSMVTIAKGEIYGLAGIFENLSEFDGALLAATTEELEDVAEQYPFYGFNNPNNDFRKTDDFWLLYMLKVSYIKQIYVIDANKIVDLSMGFDELMQIVKTGVDVAPLRQVVSEEVPERAEEKDRAKKKKREKGKKRKHRNQNQVIPEPDDRDGDHIF